MNKLVIFKALQKFIKKEWRRYRRKIKKDKFIRKEGNNQRMLLNKNMRINK